MIRLFRHLFTGDNLVSVLLLAVVVTAVAHAVAACHGEKAKPEPPPPPKLVIERRACAEMPPPAPTPGAVVYDAGSPAGPCPENYVVCLPREGMIELLRYVEEVHTWARDVFTACGPPPAPAVPATAPGGAP